MRVADGACAAVNIWKALTLQACRKGAHHDLRDGQSPSTSDSCDIQVSEMQVEDHSHWEGCTAVTRSQCNGLNEDSQDGTHACFSPKRTEELNSFHFPIMETQVLLTVGNNVVACEDLSHMLEGSCSRAVSQEEHKASGRTIRLCAGSAHSSFLPISLFSMVHR